MKNLLIYGMGKVFLDNFIKSDFALNCLMQDGYRILGVTDKNSEKIMERNLNEKIHFLPREDALKKNFDAVLVTSTKYYDEIRRELIRIGVNQDLIHNYNDFLDDWYDKTLNNASFVNKGGVEIGGPTRFFSGIYRVCNSCDDVNFSTDTIWWQKENDDSFVYEGRKLGKVYIADAVNLKIICDQSYDFVLSSNNLEHIANPIRALKEWIRIMRCDGVLVLVVPCKDVTFDHARPYTSFEHLLQDYEKGIEEDDLSHLPEIRELHDYAMDVACGGKEAFLARAQKNFENRCLHHHVFDEKCLKLLWNYLRLKILDFTEIHDNYCIIGKK